MNDALGNYGSSCYAEDTTGVVAMSSDFLEVAGAFISDGVTRTPNTYFCGIATDLTQFVGVSCEYNLEYCRKSLVRQGIYLRILG